MIQGYTGHVAMWANRTPFRQPFLETADQVFADGSAPPCIVVYVDAWTSYGGIAVRRLRRAPGGTTRTSATRSCRGWTRATGRCDDRASRAISGKSSGGFGAMITPMLRPDLFGALATHAGDTLYEHCYLPDFADAVRHLRAYDGDIWRWWDDFRSRPSFTKAEDASLLTALGCSAALLRRATTARPVLPFDPRTGVLRDDECGSAGWTGTRSGWSTGTPTRCAACGRSGSTPGPATTTTSTSARRRSGTGSRGSAYRTTGCTSSCSTPPTPAIDYRYPLALAWLAQRLAR